MKYSSESSSNYSSESGIDGVFGDYSRCKSLTVIVELACFESRVQVSKPGSGCPGFSRPFLLHSALSVSGVQFPLITRPERSRDSTCSIDTARAFTGVASCLEI